MILGFVIMMMYFYDTTQHNTKQERQGVKKNCTQRREGIQKEKG